MPASARHEDTGAPAAAQGRGPVRRTFRSREVTQLLGVSRRQLGYWAQTDLVRPSGVTRGGHYRYSFQDLVALKAAKRLIDAGVSVQRIRKSVEALKRLLPTVRRPLGELVLVATGDLVLVMHRGAAFEAISGQEWVLDVARFQLEVDAFRGRGRGRSPAAAGAQRHTA